MYYTSTVTITITSTISRGEDLITGYGLWIYTLYNMAV